MEIKYFLMWYLLFFVFGVIGLPITSMVFKNWQDKGYAFSKYIGLFVVGMFWWLLSSIKILPFTPVVGLVLILIAFAGSLYWLYRTKFKITKYMLVEEAIFLLLLTVWTLIRSTNPRAEGTEKMMNLAFMNSINRTEYFPPMDMWMSQSGNINYYYLGHYFFVLVGKVGSIAMSYVYNYALVTIIAQTFIGLFSIFIELFRKGKEWIKLTFAIFGATWICFAGNLHLAYTWFAAYFQGKEFTYFFPDSTRIIEYTINEYPAYSIVLGDVHGHYIALPFLVIVLALGMVALKKKIGTKSKLKFNMIISPLIVALYGINSWDMITAVFVFTLIHIYQVMNLNEVLETKIKHFVLAQLSLLIPGIVLMLPYIINYSPAVGPEGGFPLGIVPFRTKSAPLPWMQFWFQFLIAPVLFALAIKLKVVSEKAMKVYPLILTFAAVCLIVGVEFFFIKDIFNKSNPPYFRTNTVFKFYYHAWVIFGIAAVSFIYSILHGESKSVVEGAKKAKIEVTKRVKFFKTATFTVATAIFVLTFSYIFVAIGDFYPLSKKEMVRTMNGIDFISKDYPSDYSAIAWLNSNVSGQPVILEEVGEAYTYSSRVSTATGLPTVIGWPTHEWQWRGSSEEPFSRKNEVDAFYNGTSDVDTDKEFLNKYEIEYIYVGNKERESYPQLDIERIKQYGDVVYEGSETYVLKVKPEMLAD